MYLMYKYTQEVVVIINPAYIPHLQVNQIIIIVCKQYIKACMSLAGTTEVAPPATPCAPKHITSDPGANPGTLPKGDGY